MKRKSLVVSLVLLAGILLAQGVFADLKDYIVIVKPVFHEKTRALFLDLAKAFGDQGAQNEKDYFTAMAGEHAHGSGWVVVDSDGQNYIITNRHVVIEAQTVNVYIEAADGTQTPYLDCPILYVDEVMDLAVCQFPKAQKVFKTGFKIETAAPKDLTQVVAAGFPGFGSQPLWQVSPGAVTNSQARVDPAYDYMIQHSAPIDPGNSGGPLLVKDDTTALGYGVVGVNTSKAVQRESTNFAIPVKYVSAVLEKARSAKKLQADPQAMRAELVRSCKALAGELGSQHPVDQKLNQYISYAIVGAEGWDAFKAVVGVAEQKDEFWNWFMEDPVDAMRTSIYWLFRAEATRPQTPVEFRGIVFADDGAIGTKGEIRTDFQIGGKQKEIVWTLEYGQWRISDVDLQLPAATAAAAAAPAAGTTSEPPAETETYPHHSVLLGFGVVGTGVYYGVEYSGMIFSDFIGLSAALGSAEDGSVFALAGVAFAPFIDLLIPLRLGIAVTPLGTTFVLSPGALLKLDFFAVELDVGFVLAGDTLFGLGVGVNF
jgi:serine protease Do